MAMAPQLLQLSIASTCSSNFSQRFSRTNRSSRLCCSRIGFSDYAEEECKLPKKKFKELEANGSNGNGSPLAGGFSILEDGFQAGIQKHDPDILVRSIRTLILDNYDSYTYNLFQLLSVVNGVPPIVFKNDELTFRDLRRLLYKDMAFDNVVISPGPGSPVRSSDIGICMQLLQECHDIPVLGVCMGHQALGYAHGMKVMHAPQPVHGRLSEVKHLQHPLFSGIPSGSGFKVVRYHSLILDSSSLPPSLFPTAWTFTEKPVSCRQTVKVNNLIESPLDTTEDNEAFTCPDSTKLLMGVSHKKWPHHGVQFHPESIATSYGQRLLENFRDITRRYWQDNPVQYAGTTGSFKNIGLSRTPKFFESRVKHLRLYVKKLHNIEAVVGGSENIFHKIYGNNDSEDTFWLDSSNIDQGRARFSYMGARGGPLWRKITYTLSDSHQGVLRTEDVTGNVLERTFYGGFFQFMNMETQKYACKREEYEHLPFDFIGGFVGYLGYELKCECGVTLNRHKSSLPDAAFFMVDRFTVVDHANGDVYIIAAYDDNEGDLKDAEDWVESTAGLVNSLSGNVAKPNSLRRCIGDPDGTPFFLSKDKNEYVKDVERCLEYISDGESYEICLTAQMKTKILMPDLLELYSVLRRTNPAPYAAWLHFGGEGPCICSSSPERFLQLDRTGTIEAKPIKGTVPRGKSKSEDIRLRLQLEQSEKDQAENLMIVDLLRNDLGRVCVPGSVHVPHLMALETYSTVHTLVSTVRGKKRDDETPIDCVKAAFPGGSMTGAPKIRTMEILDIVETSPRGVYSGSIGFFSFNSSFDLSIVIRTLVIQDGEISIGAGGAIVALSDPEGEFEEMLLKTRAPTKAVKICQAKQRT